MKLTRLIASLFLVTVVALPASALALSTPQNLTLVGGIYTSDNTPTFTWSYSPGATWFEYRHDSATYTGIGSATSITLPAQADGWHGFVVRARDNNGNISGEATLNYEIDTVGPTVPLIEPSGADEDEEVTLSVKPTGESTVNSCDLYISGDYIGHMTQSGSKFIYDFTFTRDGHYSIYTKCTDWDGNTTKSATRTFWVDKNTSPTNNTSNEADKGDLIKMTCPKVNSVNDPCRAVYYWGDDNRRHAFPNEGVFFSWYTDFDDVVEVSDDFMSDIQLGQNVTYKPGTVVIKFDTSEAVYAVAEGGILRHYLTPSLVAADYGSNWYHDYLVSVPDVFFNDYSVGTVIDSNSDYDPDDAEDNVIDIDDNF
jgi:hypothetical protein